MQNSTIDEPYVPGSAQLRNVRRFNKIARFILNSPFHGALSKHLTLLQFTGRKSGTAYTTPIAYVEDDRELLIAAGARWRVNLHSRPLVTVRLRGRWLAYRASIAGAHEYAAELVRMAHLNRPGRVTRACRSAATVHRLPRG
jgi:deazaflavin-dependent oxidoreductase (nitroreductase family)